MNADAGIESWLPALAACFEPDDDDADEEPDDDGADDDEEDEVDESDSSPLPNVMNSCCTAALRWCSCGVRTISTCVCKNKQTGKTTNV